MCTELYFSLFLGWCTFCTFSVYLLLKKCMVHVPKLNLITVHCTLHVFFPIFSQLWSSVYSQPALYRYHMRATNWGGWRVTHASPRDMNPAKKKALSAFFCIHDHTDALDWLLLLWLTGETEYTTPSHFAPLAHGLWMAVASPRFKLTISLTVWQKLFCCHF